MNCNEAPHCVGMVVGLLLVFAAGCESNVPSDSPDNAHDVSDSLRLPSDPDTSLSPNGQVEIHIQVADREAFDRLVEQRRGKVVLVDFWATWCTPCVKQFPHTVDLHKKYADRGLAVISVSMDEVENLDAVRRFLDKHGAEFDNLLGNQGSTGETFQAFELSGVPAYRIYDRSGKLRKEYSVDPSVEKQYTLKEIEQLVTELVDSS